MNVDLSQEGRRQAALLGCRLTDWGIDALYSSDLIRAVQTAREINRFLSLPHTICPDLREISFGEMEGLTNEEIGVRFKEFKKQQETMTADLPYPGGECAGDDRPLPGNASGKMEAFGKRSGKYQYHGAEMGSGSPALYGGAI